MRVVFIFIPALESGPFRHTAWPGGNIARKRGQGLFKQNIFSKYIAYQYLFRNEPDNKSSLALASALLINEKDGNQRYGVELKHLQGKMATGFLYNNAGWYFQIAAEVSTLEYKAATSVLPYHRYASLQMGKKF